MKKYFHITSGDRIIEILNIGLIPQVGERYSVYSKMFESNPDKCIHVCKDYDFAINLSRTHWRLHPDFKRHGQFLLEVNTCETGVQDPSFDGGLILKHKIGPEQINLIKML